MDAWVPVDSMGPGPYTFWIEYTPPYLSPEDRQALTAEGVLFPDTKLASPKLEFAQSP
jgi:hypothetical protein